jgi:hypothetical protein
MLFNTRRKPHLAEDELVHDLHLGPTFVVARASMNTQSTGKGIKSPNHRSLSKATFAYHSGPETL